MTATPEVNTLRPEHLYELERSGITPEVIAEAGLRSITHDEADGLGFRNGGGAVDGLLFPFIEPETWTPSKRFACLKPDRQVNGAKYLSPVRERPRLYWAPSVTAEMLKDSTIPLLIVEGIKKTLSVESWRRRDGRRAVVIGINGCWGWWRAIKGALPDGSLGKIGREPIADLALIEWKDREVIVCLDGDVATNEKIAIAERVLVKNLKRRGASVRAVRIPPAPDGSRRGADDFLVAEGDEAWARLLEEARDISLPRINADDGNLERIASKSWAALDEANEPPQWFRYAGVMARIEADDEGNTRLGTLDLDRTRFILARAAEFYVTKKDKETKEEIEVDAHPPIAVVRDMLARPDPPLPVLTRIVPAPIFSADGTLESIPGYSDRTLTYYAPAPDFAPLAVPLKPTDADVIEAVGLLVDELLGDFPFTGPSERAHAVALMILPFVREMIDGPTPLHLGEKTSPGTGGTLLIETLATPFLGRVLSGITEAGDEDEWRKRLTSKFMEGPSFLFIDNLREPLESGHVSSALTAPEWEDRLLGKNQQVHARIRCAWAATGNNPSVSNEIARRTIRIRLDAKMDQPWLRKPDTFRHRLPEWAIQNRAELVRACLILCRAWIAAGKPEAPNRPTLGMFESWARVMGGILHTCHLPGFLANLPEFYERTDTEGAAWRAFVTVWAEKHGEALTGVSELYPVVRAADLFDLGDKGERSEKSRLGRLIAKQRDRRIGDYTITKGPDFNGAGTWKLTKAES